MQISDSHIGFNKPANADVNATLQVAIDKINGLAKAPDFMIHTGRPDPSRQAVRVRYAGPTPAERQNKTGASTFPASTTTPPTTARNISPASAREPREQAGIASTTTACIS